MHRSHSAPIVAYGAATVTLLPSSTVNSTHWTANILCKGCSKWENGSVDPQKANNFALAWSRNAVSDSSNSLGTFPVHDFHSYFALDVTKAKIHDFDGFIRSMMAPSLL
jgi:cellobiose dehydrogenase (acceptor)